MPSELTLEKLKLALGGHRHRPNDPIEGVHVGLAGGGVHDHPVALGRPPKLSAKAMADAHRTRPWLPGFVRARIRERSGPTESFGPWREWSEVDFAAHVLHPQHWTTPSFDLQSHVDLFLGPDRLIDKVYEFADGTVRPVAEGDFKAEAEWFAAQTGVQKRVNIRLKPAKNFFEDRRRRLIDLGEHRPGVDRPAERVRPFVLFPIAERIEGGERAGAALLLRAPAGNKRAARDEALALFDKRREGRAVLAEKIGDRGPYPVFRDVAILERVAKQTEATAKQQETGRFRLLRRFWRVRQEVREGSVKEFFELYQDFGKRTVRLLRLETDPTESGTATGTFAPQVAKRLIERVGTFASDEIEPPGPAKVGTVTIEEVDEGRAELVEDGPERKVLRLGGKKLSGQFVMTDEGGGVWSLSSEKSKTLKLSAPSDGPNMAEWSGYEWSRFAPIIKVADGPEERVFWCEVHRGMEVDLQGDWIEPMTLRRAAWNFLQEFRKIKLMHGDLAKVSVVESFVTFGPTPIGSERVPGDVWIVALRVHDEALWKRIKNGEFTGLSLGGSAKVRPGVRPSGV